MEKEQQKEQQARPRSRWIFSVILGLLLLPVLLFEAVQTRYVKDGLVHWLEAAVNAGTGFQVKIGRLDGFLPFDVQLDRLTVADRQGEWLDVEEFHFAWSPWSLLKGIPRVYEVYAGGVRLERIPRDAEGEKREKGSPLRPPSIPPFLLDRFAVKRITLGETVLGQSADFSLNGRLVSAGPLGGVEGGLAVRRIKGPRSSTFVQWSLKGREPQLILDAVLQEGREGLLPSLLGVEAAGPSVLKLRGEGPLDNWKGFLTARAEGLGALETKVTLSLTGEPALKGEGEFTMVASRLPEQAVSFLGDRKVGFAFDIESPNGDEWLFRRVRFEVREAGITLEGRLNQKEKHFDGSFDLAITDLSPLKALAGEDIGGGFSAKGRVSGPFERPRLTLAVSLLQPAWSALHASSAECELELEPLAPLTSPFQGLALKGNGRVEGLRSLHEDRIPPQHIQWSAVANFAPGRPVEVQKLELQSDAIRTGFTGQVNPENGHIDGRTFLDISDLSRIASWFGSDLRGKVQLEALTEGYIGTGALSAQIKGRMSDPGPLPPLLLPLTEDGISYSANVNVSEGRHVTVSGLTVTASAVELTGDGSLDLLNKEAIGRGHVQFQSLATFSRALGHPLEGVLGLDLEVRDFLRDPELIVNGRGRRILINKVRVQDVWMSLDIKDLIKRPEGQIRVDLREGGQRVSGGSDFALEGRKLLLSGVHLNSSGTEIKGHLDIHLDDLTGEGALRGKAEDLGKWSPFLGQELGGRLSFNTLFTKGSRGQDISLEALGHELTTPLGNAGELACKVRLDNVFNIWNGRADVRIKAFHQKDLALRSLTLNAEGGLNEVRFSGNGSGTFREDFSFEVGGEMGLSQKSRHLRVHLLKGQFGGASGALQGPAVIRRTPNETVLEEAVFHLEEGEFRVEGRLGEDDLSLKARMEKLPLDLLRLVGVPDLMGHAHGRLHVNGRPAGPEADMELHFDKVRLRDEAFRKFPPADIHAKGSFREGLLRMDLSIEGVSEKPARANVQVPAVVSFTPLVLALKPRGEIRGGVSAEIRLERIRAFFPMEDHILKGLLVAEGDMGGSVESPEIRGLLRILDGTYENTQSGTVLKDVRIVARLSGDRLDLEEARAVDGSEGIIEIGGGIRFDPAEGFPFKSNIQLKQCTLIRRDDLTAALDGHLAFSGTKDKSNVSGTLTVGPAEIRIPDRFPPEVAELEVQEINFPDNQPGREQKPKLKKTGKLNLDLNIESPGRIFVRGRGLDSEWRGSLRISGEAKEPVIKGDLSVIKGRFNLFGKPFSLSKGAISFGGATPPEPRFNVEAENRRSGLTTRILFSGTPSSPGIALKSDPSYPTDEILSRLLFGKSVAGITPIQALRLAYAVNTLSGGSSMFDFMDQTRKLIGVDQLEFKQAEDAKKSTSVSAGKYLNDDVYVEIEKGVGSEGGKVSVEVDITPNISVESEAGLDAQSGVGINWKWDY